MSSRWVRLSVV